MVKLNRPLRHLLRAAGRMGAADRRYAQRDERQGDDEAGSGVEGVSTLPESEFDRFINARRFEEVVAFMCSGVVGGNNKIRYSFGNGIT